MNFVIFFQNFLQRPSNAFGETFTGNFSQDTISFHDNIIIKSIKLKQIIIFIIFYFLKK